MPEIALLAAGLSFLMPLGYALIGTGGLLEDRARQAALGLLAALGLATLGYLVVGFGLQFGGISLVYNRPGYEGLVWEWSALGPAWGSGWGMAGLTGWGLTGAAATPAAYALALSNLPWVATAAMIPLIGLRGRIPAWATAVLGLLVGALVYPLAGNWIWGGGWLANLGTNLNQGHGLVDAGGSGLVHLVGAAVMLAGLLVFLPRKPRVHPGEPVPLPPVHLPVLAVFGAGLLLIGSAAWWIANPLLDRQSIDLAQVLLVSFLAAAGGALLPLFYTWFVAGTPDPLMAARGVAAGSIVVLAGAPFMSPIFALAIGCAMGLIVPLAIFFVDRVVRINDPTSALTVHGLSGALGLLAVGVLADGRTGQGWNGVGLNGYLGVARQGVTGMLAATGFQPDWPSQFQAQAVGLAALALFGFFAAWLVLAPPATVLHFLAQPRPSRLPQPVPERKLSPTETFAAAADRAAALGELETREAEGQEAAPVL